jgi:UDP-glucose 4-epimerase
VNAVSRRLADTAAAQRDLGFRTEVSLEDGLRALVEWWQPQREAVAAGRQVTR